MLPVNNSDLVRIRVIEKLQDSTSGDTQKLAAYLRQSQCSEDFEKMRLQLSLADLDVVRNW